MMVSCPGCNTHYSLDERKLPAKGGMLTCRECGKRWKIASPDEKATASAPAPPPPQAPTHPPTAGRSLESSAKLRKPVNCPKCGHMFLPHAPAGAPLTATGERAAVTRPAVSRILLVEDQNYFAELTREALGSEYETVVAPNLPSARSVLAEGHFDLVILDLSLESDQDGAQILQTTRRRRIPVLIFTARDETEIYGETWKNLQEAGATDILIKGMNVGDELRQKVQAMTAASRA